MEYSGLQLAFCSLQLPHDVKMRVNSGCYLYLKWSFDAISQYGQGLTNYSISLSGLHEKIDALCNVLQHTTIIFQ